MKSIMSFKQFAFIAILFVSLASCKKKNDEVVTLAGKPNYGIWLQLGAYPNTTQYVVGSNDLTTGKVSLVGNGAEVTSKADYGILPHKGYYYYPSTSADFGKFTKFQFSNNQLNVVKEVPFTYQSRINTHAWIDDNTLILVGANGDRNKLLYSIVNATTLAITNGEFSLPAIPTGYKYYNSGSLEYSNGKLYLAFSNATDWPGKSEAGVNVAVIDYPAMTLNTVIESANADGHGGASMWEPTSGVDESGNVYMMFFAGYNTEATSPSKIFRINSGATSFDSYDFNIGTALDGETTEGFWYIGKNKAIVKYTDSKLTSDINSETDYFRKYALVDLSAKTATKLDIPAEKGSGIGALLVDGEKVFIAANDKDGKDYVWNVNTTDGSVTPGLEIVGGYDYILRLDNLK